MFTFNATTSQNRVYNFEVIIQGTTILNDLLLQLPLITTLPHSYPPIISNRKYKYFVKLEITELNPHPFNSKKQQQQSNKNPNNHNFLTSTKQYIYIFFVVEFQNIIEPFITSQMQIKSQQKILKDRKLRLSQKKIQPPFRYSIKQNPVKIYISLSPKNNNNNNSNSIIIQIIPNLQIIFRLVTYCFPTAKNNNQILKFFHKKSIQKLVLNKIKKNIYIPNQIIFTIRRPRTIKYSRFSIIQILVTSNLSLIRFFFSFSKIRISVLIPTQQI
eukprot:TRINITY_DN694_c2_g2_i2.p2 TRINITY_DN694_c2_g2~~TRINITY_DN694_c2_g2_i2.p2  ORF type:complete len:285 (+),score=-6.46 TRINITY_DN694_c2_g2_i2:42-857(+)